MSLPFTIDNHFTFGYNGIPFVEKKNHKLDKFFCSYSRCSRNPGSFKQECINTANEVYMQAKQLGRIPYLFLSGGLDSEVVVKAFIDAKVEFKIISFRFKNNFSSHETYYIDRFIKKNNLKHIYYDIDPEWLFTDEAEDYINQSQCSQSEMLPHMKLIKHVWDNLDGFPVLGNGDLYVSKDISVDWIFDRNKPKYIWNYIEYEYILAWNRFAIKNNILGCLGFFMHNPEIVLSMIKEPEMNNCINNKIPRKLSSRSTKSIVYINSWNDLELRVKYNGSEYLRGKYLKLNRKYSTKFEINDIWKIPINDFEKILEPIW